ncbi:MAG: nucleotidyltransferase family protein [Hyphomicrobiales bacterium]|nr:MAG: nucleotidyltransferase family protein [Hyphomicrobiales bacterium]
MTGQPSIAAIVLAAGRSSRMGHFKLLADVGGEPMLRKVVRAALEAQAQPVIVVTGNEADAVRQSLSGLDVAFVHNPDFALGLSTSLKAGITALPAGVAGALVMLGDMPLLEARHLEFLLAAFEPGRIVVPVRGGRQGNPVIWPRETFAPMADLSGDAGAKKLLSAFAANVREVEMPDDAIFRDIDTPDALGDLQREIRARPPSA